MESRRWQNPPKANFHRLEVISFIRHPMYLLFWKVSSLMPHGIQTHFPFKTCIGRIAQLLLEMVDGRWGWSFYATESCWRSRFHGAQCPPRVFIHGITRMHTKHAACTGHRERPWGCSKEGCCRHIVIQEPLLLMCMLTANYTLFSLGLCQNLDFLNLAFLDLHKHSWFWFQLNSQI